MRMMTTFPGPLACGLLLAGAMAAFGHGGATGIVGERMMGMMMLSEQIKLLAPVADRPAADDIDVLSTAAEMISMHAGPAMTNLFPEGSLDSPSEARPAIWERWREFTGYAGELGKLGAELGAAAKVLATPSPVVEAMPVEPAPARPEPSEWERMDYAWLMGIAEQPEATTDPQTTGSIAGAGDAPSVPILRPVKAIYSDIAATCAACHAAFRR